MRPSKAHHPVWAATLFLIPSALLASDPNSWLFARVVVSAFVVWLSVIVAFLGLRLAGGRVQPPGPEETAEMSSWAGWLALVAALLVGILS